MWFFSLHMLLQWKVNNHCENLWRNWRWKSGGRGRIRWSMSQGSLYWETFVLLLIVPTNIFYNPIYPEWQSYSNHCLGKIKKQNKTVDVGSGGRENNVVEVMEPAARMRLRVAGDGVWEIHWQVMNNDIHGEMGEATPSLPRCSHPRCWIAFWVCIELEEDCERKEENIRVPAAWHSLIFFSSHCLKTKQNKTACP